MSLSINQTKPRPINLSADRPALRFSFCTLVTDRPQYEAMIGAFAAKGFSEPDCEFLFIDNAGGSRSDAFTGYNRFLLAARGEYVVLCHQDLWPLADGRDVLDAALAALTAHDPAWALCGNAGVTAAGVAAIRISDPRGENVSEGGPFPVRVANLDENFIVVRRAANLALSRDLTGYHWYGADLCLIADILGWRAYVVDFHLRHHSGGTLDAQFAAGREAFAKKYAATFRSRWHYVITRRHVFLSGSPIRRAITRLPLRWLFGRALRKARAARAP